jgi:hypothetical protein
MPPPAGGRSLLCPAPDTILHHVLSTPPEQVTVTNAGSSAVVGLRPGGTADVFLWATDSFGWLLEHWGSDAPALLDPAWSPGSSVREGSALVPLPTADPAVLVQWDHELRVVHRRGPYDWAQEVIDAGPTEDCARPPYDPGDVCLHDEGYLAPIATWADGANALIVYGRYTRTGQRTATYMPGPAGGYFAWTDPPPWNGTVEYAVFDPAAGTVSAPALLLDGVVASAGQAVLDGSGQVQLVMKDHACRAFEDWATRIAVVDPAAL